MNEMLFAQTGKTPLHYAASNGHCDCMKLLVHQYKFDPDKADSVSYSYLLPLKLTSEVFL